MALKKAISKAKVMFSANPTNSTTIVAFVLDGSPRRVAFAASQTDWWLDDGQDTRWFGRARSAGGGHDADPGQVKAPMDGEVTAVTVSAGDPVQAGTPLLVLEAMKIEHRLLAPRPGRISALHTAPGARVRVGDVLVDIDTEETADG